MSKFLIIRTVFILAVISLLAVQGCKKKAYKVDPNFLGYWTSDYGEIIIEREIFSSSYSHSGVVSVNATGTARVSKRKNILKIGLKKLDINQYPIFDQTTYIYDVWVMVIDGEYYFRSD